MLQRLSLRNTSPRPRTKTCPSPKLFPVFYTFSRTPVEALAETLSISCLSYPWKLLPKLSPSILTPTPSLSVTLVTLGLGRILSCGRSLPRPVYGWHPSPTTLYLNEDDDLEEVIERIVAWHPHTGPAMTSEASCVLIQEGYGAQLPTAPSPKSLRND